MTALPFLAAACAGLPLTHHLIAEPEATYAAGRKHHLTSHALADFRKNPLLFRHKELGLIPPEDRAAFVIGRAVHCRVLEGEGAFRSRFAIGGPINPKTGRAFGADTKAWAEWAAAIGKPAIGAEVADLCEQLADAVRAHAVAAELLAEGQAEGVVRTEFAGMPCQSRLDWVHPGRGLVDLKTIDDLDWFEVQCRTFGYIHQLAFYRNLLGAVCGSSVPVHLVAVEKKAPFRVGAWRISDQALDVASRENLAAIQRLKICREQDRWPTGYEQVRVFDYIG